MCLCAERAGADTWGRVRSWFVCVFACKRGRGRRLLCVVWVQPRVSCLTEARAVAVLLPCLCSAAPDSCFGTVFVAVGAAIASINKLPMSIIKVDVGTAGAYPTPPVRRLPVCARVLWFTVSWFSMISSSLPTRPFLR